MKLPHNLHRVEPQPSPAHAALTNRPGVRTISTPLKLARDKDVRWRLRLHWRDAAAPSGEREEIVFSTSPAKILALAEEIARTPDRPLVRAAVEALPLARWQAVPLEYLRQRAARDTRRVRPPRPKGGAS